MQSNTNILLNCWNEEQSSLKKENQLPQQLVPHPPYHSPHQSTYQPSHQPTHQPPQQQLLQEQLEQDLFDYAPPFNQKSSLLQLILTHGREAVTETYYADLDKHPQALSINNQIVPRISETNSSSSSNQTSPTIAECNQSVANLQEPYRQQQNFYGNYVNHPGSYNPSTFMTSRPTMQAPYPQTICSQQQQDANYNNNSYKQRNRHTDINNTDGERLCPPFFDSSIQLPWINKTNGKSIYCHNTVCCIYCTYDFVRNISVQ